MLIITIILLTILFIQFTIMAKQSELAEKINLLTAQVNKIGSESTKSLELIAELKTALENQENVSPELQAAFDNLEAQVTLGDELVPDAPVVEETGEEASAE